MPRLRSADLPAEERPLQHYTAHAIVKDTVIDHVQSQENSQVKEQTSVTNKGAKIQQKRSSSNKAGKSTLAALNSEATPESAVQPTSKKRAKVRKALLSTLWSTENIATLQTKVERLYTQLNELYEDPPCPLNYDSPFQLLVAVILSAQVCSEFLLKALPHVVPGNHCTFSGLKSTDKKVNEITPALFKLATDAHAMAAQEVLLADTCLILCFHAQHTLTIKVIV